MDRLADEHQNGGHLGVGEEVPVRELKRKPSPVKDPWNSSEPNVKGTCFATFNGPVLLSREEHTHSPLSTLAALAGTPADSDSFPGNPRRRIGCEKDGHSGNILRLA